MKKILPILLIAFSTQTLADITIDEYPAALTGSWRDTAPLATELTFSNTPQTIEISHGDCIATGSYALQIAVEIAEKSSCWEFECFQMDITINATKGDQECRAQYPLNHPFFMNMRLQADKTLLFGEDLIFKKR